MPAPHPARQRAARARLANLLAHPEGVYVVHYACESFDSDAQNVSPRVTAIAARNVASSDTQVFSIHAEVEVRRLAPVQILSRLDELEAAMLAKYFAFLKINRQMRFVHWNMRDALYGFQAIEHRGAVLGIEAFAIADSQKFDLARLIIDIYGAGYVDKPYQVELAKKNGLSLDGYLPGDLEAEAFERGGYAIVQRSVLAKVRVMFDILHLAHDRTLKTGASWWTLNFGRLREAAELMDDNPVKAIAGLAVAGLSFGIFAVTRLW
ncbi:MAG: hypothetical protein NW205_02280 [Hyphomicrobiaceae bacterium]|nr:hypothetical protein [Hyphomicrobiaceae bacterium]